MRRKNVKPKDRRKVQIPDELRESMREVHEYLLDAERNDDVSIDFDDAIQVGAVCGGRTGAKKRPFVFTYYPSGDSRRGCWSLTLDRFEIEDIGDGHMTEIKMHCCTSPNCRTKSREADTTCFYCDYDDDERDEI